MQDRIDLPGKFVGMKPHEFIDSLLVSKGLTGNGFARELGKPKWQPTINRFLNGKTKDPRAEWVEPAAKKLGVSTDAFRSELVATSEAERLGLSEPGRKLVAMQPQSRYRAQSRIDPGMIAIQIGDLMREHDDAVRAAAAALFSGAAMKPDEAATIAARLRGLLAEAPASAQKTEAR